MDSSGMTRKENLAASDTTTSMGTVAAAQDALSAASRPVEFTSEIKQYGKCKLSKILYHVCIVSNILCGSLLSYTMLACDRSEQSTAAFAV